jgi:fatty acid desaturase
MTDEAMNEGAVCMPNIGPRERKKRARFGMVALVVAVAAAGAMFALHSPRWSRVALFVPLAGAMLGFLQAREKT